MSTSCLVLLLERYIWNGDCGEPVEFPAAHADTDLMRSGWPVATIAARNSHHKISSGGGKCHHAKGFAFVEHPVEGTVVRNLRFLLRSGNA